jgi:hypothetical protein
VLQKHHEHPRVTTYNMWALWSINERLANRPGVDLPRPDDTWIMDVVAAVLDEGDEISALMERARKEQHASPFT